jgi:hypothetical protein
VPVRSHRTNPPCHSNFSLKAQSFATTLRTLDPR